jgi:hypothetical protein
MSTQYTRDYFIAKFEAIPEELWTTGEFKEGEKCCAFGHCGVNLDCCHNEESEGLIRLMLQLGEFVVTAINDGEHPDYQQPTPKQRILAALHDLPA